MVDPGWYGEQEGDFRKTLVAGSIYQAMQSHAKQEALTLGLWQQRGREGLEVLCEGSSCGLGLERAFIAQEYSESEV